MMNDNHPLTKVELEQRLKDELGIILQLQDYSDAPTFSEQDYLSVKKALIRLAYEYTHIQPCTDQQKTNS